MFFPKEVGNERVIINHLLFTFLKTSITVTHLRNRLPSRTEIAPFTMFQKIESQFNSWDVWMPVI